MATKLFQVQSVLRRKLFAVSTRNIPQQKTIRTLTSAMALAQGKWVKVCSLTHTLVLLQIVCFCFLRLTLIFRCTFRWFHLFHTYQFIEKEEKLWLICLISLCFLDRKVWLIFEGFTFDFGLLINPRNWNGLQVDFLNLWMIYEMQNHTDDTKANSFIIR